MKNLTVVDGLVRADFAAMKRPPRPQAGSWHQAAVGGVNSERVLPNRGNGAHKASMPAVRGATHVSPAASSRPFELA